MDCPDLPFTAMGAEQAGEQRNDADRIALGDERVQEQGQDFGRDRDDQRQATVPADGFEPPVASALWFQAVARSLSEYCLRPMIFE